MRPLDDPPMLAQDLAFGGNDDPVRVYPQADGAIPGFDVPVHRSLTEPILLGGAPRALAIVNGTLAGAVGLGLRLWIAGLVLWAIGHVLGVWAAHHDPNFVDVARRHVRYPTWLRA